MKRLIGMAAALLLVGGAALSWGLEDETVEVVHPVALAMESPFRYPIALWDTGAEGETVLMVHVTPEGAVDTAYVLEPSGQPAFDSAALAGARALRFAPGRRGTEPVPMWARLPVRFHLPDDSVSGGV